MARVLLQMGHCFRRTGATGTGGIDADPTEQEFAQAACYAAAAMLRTAGHAPVVIDADEPDSSYRGFDAFFAVHCDGSTSATARGASVGYRTAEGAHLAAAFKQAYYDAGWRGFRPDNYTAALAGYYGVREAVEQGCRHATIVEAGFLTSPQDEALLTPPDGTDRCARAITNAVVALWGGARPAPTGRSSDMLTVTTHPDGTRVDVALIGADGSVWHAAAVTPDELVTAQFEWLGGWGKSIDSCWANGEYVVTVQGSDRPGAPGDNRLYVNRYVNDSVGWTGWVQHPTALIRDPEQNT